MRAGRPTRRRTSGFTLIEAIIAMAIVAIVLTAATPSFSTLTEKQRLDAASSALISDIQFARAQAAWRGENVNISLHGSGAGCYLLHTGSVAACNCADDGTSICTGAAEALKTVGFGGSGSIRLTADVPSIRFNRLHGTNSPAGTVTLTAASGRSIITVVSLMGRVRTCSRSTTAPAVPGYAAC